MSYTVLAVDDSALNHKIINKLLSGRYQVAHADSGALCLEYLENNNLPDLILMDVSMPDMDGYEACTQIKLHLEWAHIPVLFLSGRCSVEEKLKGYEVGGDEYITKPFEAEELLIKIDRHLQTKVNEAALTNRIKQVEELANSAQQDASLMMVVVDFMRVSYHLRSFERFAQELLKAIAALDLSVVIAMRNRKNQVQFFSSKSDIKPLEQELASSVLNSGQGIDAGRRFAVSEKDVAVLVLDLDDESAMRQVKAAQLITLISAAQARLENLFNELEIKRQRDILSLLVDRTKGLLEQIDHRIEGLSNQSASLVEKHAERLTELRDELHFNEFQEEVMDAEVSKLVSAFEVLGRDAIKIDSEFDRLLADLSLMSRFNSPQ